MRKADFHAMKQASQHREQDSAMLGVTEAELDLMAAYAGLDVDEFVEGIGLRSAAHNEPSFNHLFKAAGGRPTGHKEVPGVGMAARSVLHDEQFLTDARGVRENAASIPDKILRLMEKRDPIVAAAVNLRQSNARQYAKRISHDPDVPGWRIRLEDPEEKVTDEDKKVMRHLEQWFKYCGDRDFQNWHLREHDWMSFCAAMTREAMTIDKGAVEIRRDARGRVVDFIAVDGATIKRVVPGGFSGTKADFDPRSYVYVDNDFYKKLTEARIAMLPKMEEIAYVQEIDGKYTAAYRHCDMVFYSQNRRVDVRYRGAGYSPLEQAMAAITAFINALTYNSEAFSGSTIPKIAIAFKDGRKFDAPALRKLQDEWIANFRGAKGAWRIPFFTGDAQAIDLYKNPRDMEYSQYLFFTGALTLSILGVDSAELGMQLGGQAKNVMNENIDARQKFSKSRGLYDRLSFIESMANEILYWKVYGSKYQGRYCLEFTGLEFEDKVGELDNDQKRVKAYMTVDEIRAQRDLQKLPDGKGEIILDPTFLQAVQASQAAGGEGGDFGGGFDAELDDAMGDMFKAQLPARTLLL